jgi:hypothetical protein
MVVSWVHSEIRKGLVILVDEQDGRYDYRLFHPSTIGAGIKSSDAPANFSSKEAALLAAHTEALQLETAALATCCRH